MLQPLRRYRYVSASPSELLLIMRLFPVMRPCGPPPPERVYSSMGEASDSINAHAAANGYKIVKNGIKNGRARFRCAKGRTFASSADPAVHESKRRKSSTQMTACKFTLSAKKLPGGQWRVEVPQGASHNHDWNNPTSFAQNRAQALRPHRERVIELANSGIRPAQILTSIRAEEIGVIGKDIYNLLQQHRRAELRGRSPIQTLYEDSLLPSSSQFEYVDARDDQGRISSLTIAPKTGLELLQQNPDLLLLDSTYKTNCHNMPMFNACGVSPENKTFNWAVTFMSGEKEADYKTALEAKMKILEKHSIQDPRCVVSDRELALLKALNKSKWRTVPHLLCRWHVNMNVLAKTRRFFPAAIKENGIYKRHPKFRDFLKEWNALLAAPTVETFNSRLQQFRTPDRHPEKAVKYAIDTWLDPWKEKLVACWVNKISHFGHVKTSAVESAHSAVKKYLISSKADLKSVFNRLCLF